jgi:hypothetical protein
VAWDAVEHSQFEVRVPPELLNEDAAARFCTGAGAGLAVAGRRPPWIFLTLEAARGFIASGAAGEREAKLFNVVCPTLPAPVDSADMRGGGGSRTESESDSSSPRRPQRRRLDYAGTMQPDSDGAGGGAIHSAQRLGGSAAAAAAGSNSSGTGDSGSGAGAAGDVIALSSD